MPKTKPLADPRRRLYASSLHAPVQDPTHVDVDLGAFVERLLLFDTYVFHSQNLFELPALADRFGVQALIRLFKSDAVELSVDKAAFGVIRPTDGPADPYALRIDPFRYQQPQSFNKDVQLFREAYEISRLSDWRSLTSALRASVERRPSTSADLAAADRQMAHDFAAAATTRERLAPFVEAALRRNGVADTDRPYRFTVEVDDRVFHVDTDIEAAFGLNSETAGQIAQDALLALASEVHRVTEMRLFRALTPFSETDASLYTAHLDYLVRQANPDSLGRARPRRRAPRPPQPPRPRRRRGGQPPRPPRRPQLARGSGFSGPVVGRRRPHRRRGPGAARLPRRLTRSPVRSPAQDAPLSTAPVGRGLGLRPGRGRRRLCRGGE